MGYQRPLLKLTFEDPEMAGLEVLCRRPSIGQIQAYEETDRVLDRQLEIMAPCLIKWNLEDEEGSPVPPTLEGLKSQDQPFLAALIEAWVDKAIRIPAPLGQGSNGGSSPPAVSIPMEPLSASLTN